jgi:hypothetical protein
MAGAIVLYLSLRSTLIYTQKFLSLERRPKTQLDPFKFPSVSGALPLSL